MANLVFELEKKLPAQGASPAVQRNMERMKSVLEEAGLLLLDPAGEPYLETRTDLEASITGSGQSPQVIMEVIKPILYTKEGAGRTLLQKGVVIVGNKK
jgi:hypothetical protein